MDGICLSIRDGSPVSTKEPLYRFTPEKYPALTGMRAIAAYMVFLHHYAVDPRLAGPLGKLFLQCHVGVTLFYVLSGFLITYNYSERANLSRAFWWSYVSRRVGKIYPLYLCLLAITYFMQVASHRPLPTFSSALLNVTLWKGFFDEYKFDGIAPSWSLTVEETFYFLAPFLFVAVRRIGHVAVQILLYVTAGLLLLAGIHLSYHGLFGNFRFVALYTFFGRSFEFMLGMALGHALLRHPNLLTVSGRLKLTHLGVAGTALVLVWMSVLTNGFDLPNYNPMGMALNNLILPTFVCVMYLGLISERTGLGRVLSTRIFVFLGRSSYAFYLIHFSFIIFVLEARTTNLDKRLQTALLFLASAVLSAVFFLLVEHPANTAIRSWAKRFSEKPQRPKPELGRRIRRVTALWTGVVGAAFAIWSVRVFGFSGTIGVRQFAHPISAKSGFGLITSRADKLPRLTLSVGGESIAKKAFIFAHAQSRLEYDLHNEHWSVFEFSTGLDDTGGADGGSVVYVVKGDGIELFRSSVIQALVPPARYSVNVKGVRRLELLITDAGDGIAYDEAYWIEPILR